MNTEDRLRHASEEMERVTASVAAPPVERLRRSARMRGIGVAVASAVAVLVLVGGTVLLFSGRGPATLEPAEPVETTTTTTIVANRLPQEQLVVAASNPLPPISLDEENELAFLPIGDDVVAADLSRLREDSYGGPFVGDVEIVVIGQLGSSPDDPRAYAITGTYSDEADRTWAGLEGGCTVLVRSPQSPMDKSCWSGSSSGPPDGSPVAVGEGDNVNGGFWIWGSLTGETGQKASVVTVEWGSEMKWQRVRGGFFVAQIPSRSYPDDAEFPTRISVDDIVITVYDSSGEVVWTGSGSAAPTTTTGSAASCSAGDLAPSALALSSIPQPVAETLLEIVDAARACDFDRLGAIAGADFTVSFGGGDPSQEWTEGEERGGKPMYWLLSILDLPYGTVDSGDQLIYVWPSAAAFDGPWDEMPAADKQPLLGLYTEQDLQDFANYGGYVGYRLGITASGDWSFFVAGD